MHPDKLRPTPTRRTGGGSLFCGLLLLVLGWAGLLRANDAGGGAPGVGANVTLATTSTTATLSNGVIQAVIEKSTGKVKS